MISVGLHNISTARQQEFVSDGRLVGSVTITCDRGDEITLYTTPERAEAIADAINAPSAKHMEAAE